MKFEAVFPGVLIALFLIWMVVNYNHPITWFIAGIVVLKSLRLVASRGV